MKLQSLFSIVISVVVVGGLALNALQELTSETELTVRVILSESDEDITHLAQIEAFETYIPQPGEDFEPNQRFGPIFPVDDRPNVFLLEGSVQAGFTVSFGGVEMNTIATQGGGGGGTLARTLTFPTLYGLVRLDVQNAGAQPFVVQAEGTPPPRAVSSLYVTQEQEVPADGQMVFLLPQGEWTFTASDNAGQPLSVAVPRGASVDATLDLHAGG
ncbi:hypothetical protein KUL25_13535 [Rhodobacteraceae bacterium N5(2021)]|uniref:Uncharacterized protein n=1 Tax=Gymnodinialimonas phycosphaerae TaxID=2841589 RepID=A0A975TSM7_9RHOB|nr:hypothetical protein [Gymnodinialimonas phycosphaerae]MBY4893787.1 hypothetical protein [Gymnodinialimonas phycosphaerae]